MPNNSEFKIHLSNCFFVALTDMQNLKDFSKYFNLDFFLIFYYIHPFFAYILIPMITSDCMILMIIRHVLVRLRLGGPECSIPGLRSTELDETWSNGLSQLSDEERILTAI